MRRKILDGTEFVVEYDGVCHYAITEYDQQDNECYNIEAKLETLNDPSYWKTKEGVTIKSLIESL